MLTREDSEQGRHRVMTPTPVAAAASDLGLPVVKTNRLDTPRPKRSLPSSRNWASSSHTAPSCVSRCCPSPARVDQPALLAPAALARRRSGAAGDHRRRRDHRGRRVPARAGTGCRGAVRPVHPGDQATTRPPGNCSSPSRMRCGAARPGRRRTGRRNRPSRTPGRAKSRSRRSSRSRTVGSTGRADAEAIGNLIRGVTPEPGAFTTIGGARLKVLEAVRADDASPAPGQFAWDGGGCWSGPRPSRSNCSGCIPPAGRRWPQRTGGAAAPGRRREGLE